MTDVHVCEFLGQVPTRRIGAAHGVFADACCADFLGSFQNFLVGAWYINADFSQNVLAIGQRLSVCHKGHSHDAVSYTHLTLPTILLV